MSKKADQSRGTPSMSVSVVIHAADLCSHSVNDHKHTR